MLGFYQSVESITADRTLNAETTIASVPAAENAVNTITLPPAKDRVNKPVYVFNQSLFVQKVAGSSGDSVLGQALVLPGQFIRYDSDGSDWYALNPPGLQGLAEISLSAANIIAMNTTPVTLISSPGSGRVILVHSITLQIIRTATAFTGGGAVEFRYNNGSGAKVSADMSSSLITGAAGTAYASVAGVTAELTVVPAVPLVITNATAAFAAGTGTAKVRVAYSICDFN